MSSWNWSSSCYILNCVNLILASLTSLLLAVSLSQVHEGVDNLLFNLLVLGSLTNSSSGEVWRRTSYDLYVIETLPVLNQELMTTVSMLCNYIVICVHWFIYISLKIYCNSIAVLVSDLLCTDKLEMIGSWVRICSVVSHCPAAA